MVAKKVLKTIHFKSLTRKPSYSSFFSVLCPDLKNVFFGKIHRAPSEILEVKRPFSRSPRPNFGFHLFLMGFHLEFSLFCVWGRLTSATLATSEGAQGIFSKITFLISVCSNEKDVVCHSFVVKIFTKSLHRGGVFCTICSVEYNYLRPNND